MMSHEEEMLKHAQEKKLKEDAALLLREKRDKLKDWLQNQAGLTANKVEIALDQCFDIEVDTLGKLHELYIEGRLDEVFPHGIVFRKVTKALSAQTEDEVKRQHDEAYPKVQKEDPFVQKKKIQDALNKTGSVDDPRLKLQKLKQSLSKCGQEKDD